MVFRSLVVAVVLFAVVTPARADLIDLGNGMIYDSTRDITWLQDVRYSMTSGYDDDGLMLVQDAVVWASSLEFGGFDDWRLPQLYSPGWSLEADGEVPNLMSDLGWWWQFRGEPGQYPALLMAPVCASVEGPSCWTGPFLNLEPQADILASQPKIWAHGGSSQVWIPIYGVDGAGREEALAWAVRDGNAGAQRVPEPSTLLMMSIGALVCIRRGTRH